MRTFRQFAPFIQVIVFLVLGAVLIRRKRAGQWKRPWSFPVAMALLSLGIALAILGAVLELMGR